MWQPPLGEIWVEIPTLSVVPPKWRGAVILGASCGYWISESGEIKTPWGKTLKPSKEGTVQILDWSRPVATVACWAWHGAPKEAGKHYAHHKNGDRADNRRANLQWRCPGTCRQRGVVVITALESRTFASIREAERAQGIGHTGTRMRGGYWSGARWEYAKQRAVV